VEDTEVLAKCQKAYSNNTGQAPNRGFASSSYVQKIPHIRKRYCLKFEARVVVFATGSR
jgi:hypothetical protein